MNNLEILLDVKELGRYQRKVMTPLDEAFDADAIDGDGDGLVQDRTPFERPAIITAITETAQRISQGIRDAGRLNQKRSHTTHRERLRGKSHSEIAETLVPNDYASLASSLTEMAIQELGVDASPAAIQTWIQGKVFDLTGDATGDVFDFTPKHIRKLRKTVEKHLDELPMFRRLVDEYGMPPFFILKKGDFSGITSHGFGIGVTTGGMGWTDGRGNRIPILRSISLKLGYFDKSGGSNKTKRWLTDTGVRGTVLHEYGHYLAGVLYDDIVSNKYGKWEGSPDVVDFARYINMDSFSISTQNRFPNVDGKVGKSIPDVFSAMFHKPEWDEAWSKGDLPDELPHVLSFYSETNPSEQFAEGIAALLSTDPKQHKLVSPGFEDMVKQLVGLETDVPFHSQGSKYSVDALDLPQVTQALGSRGRDFTTPSGNKELWNPITKDMDISELAERVHPSSAEELVSMMAEENHRITPVSSIEDHKALVGQVLMELFEVKSIKELDSIMDLSKREERVQAMEQLLADNPSIALLHNQYGAPPLIHLTPEAYNDVAQSLKGDFAGIHVKDQRLNIGTVLLSPDTTDLLDNYNTPPPLGGESFQELLNNRPLGQRLVLSYAKWRGKYPKSVTYMTVGSNVEQLYTHEYGHYLHEQMLSSLPMEGNRERRALLRAYLSETWEEFFAAVDRPDWAEAYTNRRKKDLPDDYPFVDSAYAFTNPLEMFAESFTAAAASDSAIRGAVSPEMNRQMAMMLGLDPEQAIYEQLLANDDVVNISLGASRPLGSRSSQKKKEEREFWEKLYPDRTAAEWKAIEEQIQRKKDSTYLGRPLGSAPSLTASEAIRPLDEVAKIEERDLITTDDPTLRPGVRKLDTKAWDGKDIYQTADAGDALALIANGHYVEMTHEEGLWLALADIGKRWKEIQKTSGKEIQTLNACLFMTVDANGKSNNLFCRGHHDIARLSMPQVGGFMTKESQVLLQAWRAGLTENRGGAHDAFIGGNKAVAAMTELGKGIVEATITEDEWKKLQKKWLKKIETPEERELFLANTYMPLVEADSTPEFIRFLKQKGIDTGDVERVDVFDDVNSTQNELVLDKISGIGGVMLSKYREFQTKREQILSDVSLSQAEKDTAIAAALKDFESIPQMLPIIISKDGYIFDGHHRAFGRRIFESQLNEEELKEVKAMGFQIRRSEASISELLGIGKAYQDHMGVAAAAGGPIKVDLYVDHTEDIGDISNEEWIQHQKEIFDGLDDIIEGYHPADYWKPTGVEELVRDEEGKLVPVVRTADSPAIQTGTQSNEPIREMYRGEARKIFEEGDRQGAMALGSQSEQPSEPSSWMMSIMGSGPNGPLVDVKPPKPDTRTSEFNKKLPRWVSTLLSLHPFIDPEVLQSVRDRTPKQVLHPSSPQVMKMTGKERRLHSNNLKKILDTIELPDDVMKNLSYFGKNNTNARDNAANVYLHSLDVNLNDPKAVEKALNSGFADWISGKNYSEIETLSEIAPKEWNKYIDGTPSLSQVEAGEAVTALRDYTRNLKKPLTDNESKKLNQIIETPVFRDALGVDDDEDSVSVIRSFLWDDAEKAEQGPLGSMSEAKTVVDYNEARKAGRSKIFRKKYKSRAEMYDGASTEQQARLSVPRTAEEHHTMMMDATVDRLNLQLKLKNAGISDEPVDVRRFIDMSDPLNPRARIDAVKPLVDHVIKTAKEYEPDFSPEAIKQAEAMVAQTLNASPALRHFASEYGLPPVVIGSQNALDRQMIVYALKISKPNQEMNTILDKYQGIRQMMDEARIQEILDDPVAMGKIRKAYDNGTNPIAGAYINAANMLVIYPGSSSHKAFLDGKPIDPAYVPKPGDHTVLDNSIEATLLHEYGHYFDQRVGMLLSEGGLDPESDMAKAYTRLHHSDTLDALTSKRGNPLFVSRDNPVIETTYGQTNTQEMVAEAMSAVFSNNPHAMEMLNKPLLDDVHTLLGVKSRTRSGVTERDLPWLKDAKDMRSELIGDGTPSTWMQSVMGSGPLGSRPARNARPPRPTLKELKRRKRYKKLPDETVKLSGKDYTFSHESIASDTFVVKHNGTTVGILNVGEGLAGEPRVSSLTVHGNHKTSGLEQGLVEFAHGYYPSLRNSKRTSEAFAARQFPDAFEDLPDDHSIIELPDGTPGSPEYVTSLSEQLKRAKRDKTVAVFEYNNELRRVTVDDVYEQNGQTYMKGFDSTRNDGRTFRVDRIFRPKTTNVVTEDGTKTAVAKKPKAPRKPVAPYTGKAEELFKGATSYREVHDRLTTGELYFYDFETTGIVNHPNGEMKSPGAPVQIGVIRVVDGKVTDRHDVYMNPGVPLSQWSKDNLKRTDPDGTQHPLTDEWLATQPSIADQLKGALDFVGGEGKTFGGQYQIFDQDVMRENLSPEEFARWQRIATGFIDSKGVVDQLFPRFDKDAPQDNRLGTMTKHFGVPLSNWHDASADAEASWAVIEAAVRQAAEREERGEPLQQGLRDITATRAAHSDLMKKYDNQLTEFRQSVEQIKKETEQASKALGSRSSDEKITTGTSKLKYVGKNTGSNEFFNENTRVVQFGTGKNTRNYLLYNDRDTIYAFDYDKSGPLDGWDPKKMPKAWYVGQMSTWNNPESVRNGEPKHEIFNIDVKKSHQRRGLATAMMTFYQEAFPERKLQHSDVLSEEGKAFRAATEAADIEDAAAIPKLPNEPYKRPKRRPPASQRAARRVFDGAPLSYGGGGQ